jgi:hypothetical protein
MVARILLIRFRDFDVISLEAKGSRLLILIEILGLVGDDSLLLN